MATLSNNPPLKMTFDFSGHPDVAEALRLIAAKERIAQKEIVARALRAYFAQRQEDSLLREAATASFTEWESEEDKVYDSL